MNAMLKESHAGELVEADEFFAPTPYGLIDGLFGQYHAMRARVEHLSALMDDENGMALGYFKTGNANDDHRFPDASRLFLVGPALKALDADFWQRTLSLTDVYDCMPAKRREEWNESIRKLTTPEFTEDNVAATMEALMTARGKFLAERVDGIFQGLSRTHVTNSPAGFSKRMIIDYVFSYYQSFGTPKAELINDLRRVIAKFMGRDEPGRDASRRMLETCRADHGVWHSLDGGALRIRCYLKGTAHLEVHEDMAWRLNAILHTLYPRAIPSSFRTQPKKKAKTFTMMGRPLPFAVLKILDDMRIKGCAATFGYAQTDQASGKEVARVLQSIGGVRTDNGWSFDYDPTDVIREIRLSGCVPDKVSHQYYPTPENVARTAVDMLDAGELGDCTFLEPSAGQGAIASLLPPDFTQCVEISGLHCTILEAKGYKVAQGDFLEWAEKARGESRLFDRVCMNPPYSEGRYLAHLQAAASLLAPGGRVVCILPASQRGKDLIPGLAYEWSEVFANQFDGTSIDVAIYAGSKA
ncbi:class I SAM-dependent methyltransferase [Rhodanobacter lindaniclasticus]|uniref:DUF4942 domain-containing protein n=1 Tax=Rhodanobacter lindaniclasticus TaxID=75310 RepID=A0A4S3KCK9_9GAMM|nr:class I SAM-dependent methyltransferase [Rhodanobacter lindaniclasticus]THD06140.1 hypothetical protein B1991_14450 [Rhodanobacter lindaniclasticus]